MRLSLDVIFDDATSDEMAFDGATFDDAASAFGDICI